MEVAGRHPICVACYYVAMAHGGGGLAHHWRRWTSLEGWVSYVGGWGVSRALFLGVLFAGYFTLLSYFIPNLSLFTFGWLVGTAPIWLPVALVVGAWRMWVTYTQSLYLSQRKTMLLELRFPREITKSPRAMELALANLSLGSGETTFIHRAWKGQVRPHFSLELVSFGGQVHFYIWTWSVYKDLIESSFYAQYPDVEIIEVEDYASAFQFDPNTHTAWGMEWRLSTYMHGFAESGLKDFRINAYQPRSYVDYELDKDPKEEFKIDPLAYVLEYMSNIRQDEQLWVQIIMRKAGKQGVLGILKRPDFESMWKETVEEEVQRLRAQAAIIPSSVLEEVYREAGDEGNTARPPQPRPSWRQQRMMESMERHLAKTPFEVGVRGIYWTRGDLRGPIYAGLRALWRPYGNPNYGSQLAPLGWHNDFDYPWQDVHGIRWTQQVRRVFDAYRRRSYFAPPWRMPANILTNETLASLWHPPSRSITAPGVARTPATKAEAPVNLPV